jgi:hypothetical protein
MSTAKFTGKVKEAFEPGGKFSTEKQRREKAKPSDFLMPAQRKFPYKINGKVSCPLLRAAMVRAGQTGRTDVEARARRLYEQHCKS